MTVRAGRATAARSGPLQRLASLDLAAAQHVLETAALLIVPDDLTQRRAFERLMPNLYVLRNKGFTWGQMSKLLAECKLNLQPSTVRTYYNEMLAERMDICQARMNEQIAIMAAVRKETAGADLSAITHTVQAYSQQLRRATAARVSDALRGATPAAEMLEAPAGEQAVSPAATPRSEPAKALARPRPAPAVAHVAADDANEQDDDSPGEFGLLGLTPNSAHRPAGPAFFKLDSDPDSAPATAPTPARATTTTAPPAAPMTGTTTPAEPRGKPPSAPARPAPVPAPAPAPAPASTASTPASPSKRVHALQPGVPTLKPRPNVAANVYQEGVMEHPTIAGLFLTLEQRVYGAALEYVEADGDGEILIESADDKRFRVLWKKMHTPTPSSTSDHFVKMDLALFPEKK